MACSTSVDEFVPASGISTIANSPRVSGTDLITFVEGLDGQPLTVDTILYGYVIGLIVPSLTILVLFCFWSFAMCFAKCCCAKICKGDSFIGLIVFLTFCTGSAIGWFIAIGANAEVGQGVVGLLDSVNCGFGLAGAAVDEIQATEDLANTLSDVVTTAITSCAATSATSGDSELELTDLPSITEFLQPVLTTLQEVEDTVASLESDFNSITQPIRDYVPVYTGVFATFVVLMIIMLSVFAFTTTIGVIRVLGKEDILAKFPKVTKTAHALRCLSSTIIFIVGCIMITLFVLVLFFLGIFTSIGSDICVPSPIENALTVVETALQGSGVLAETQPLCDSGAATEYQIACHYATCTGENPILTDVDALLDELNTTTLSTTQDYLSDVQDLFQEGVDVIEESLLNISFLNISVCSDSNVATCGPVCLDQGVADAACELNSTFTTFVANVDQCLNDAGAINDAALSIVPTLDGIIDFVRCEGLTPVFKQLLEAELCNNFINGLALTYISLCLGVFGLMGAMFTYRLMDLRPFVQMIVANSVAPQQAMKVDTSAYPAENTAMATKTL